MVILGKPQRHSLYLSVPQLAQRLDAASPRTPTMPQFLICPHKGLDYLRDVVWGPVLRRVAGNGLHLDHLVAWPYDWGGCGCAEDWPWGSVGFPRFSTEILAR